MLSTEGHAVRGADIAPTLQSRLYRWSSRLYNDFVVMGLPHGGGWLDERPLTVEVIRIWSRARAAVERAAWERPNGSEGHH